MGLQGMFLFVLLLCSVAVVNCDEQQNEARQAVVQSNNQFSTALYQALSSEPGNLVMSPLSVGAVMSMAWLGARGETASQLATGLRLPDSPSQVKAGFKNLLSSLQSTQTVTLEIANKIFIQQSSGVKDDYRQAVVEHFRSDAEEVDFYNNTEAVRTSINQWVEEKTHNKIKDLIQEGSLRPEALLVIVNAIYFQGGWRKPFDESSTRMEPFHLTATSTVNVSTMRQTDRFKYGEIPELNCKALRMFYRGNNDDRWGDDATQSMLILLPNEIEGLAGLEANITTLNVSDITSRLSSSEVIVSLPRFKVEKSLKMKDALIQMGITHIFAPGADLSGITDANVYVDKVIQKAFVEVTEKGTEAAAATYAELVFMSAQLENIEFKADRPFLFLILDDTTGTILFMGRVVNPS
ncbi:ipis-1 isoform X3 [Anabrus simplex]|uniref:ipis-1 isoform X3 n=1 Tax=Anabrus simplex TaxID=316456 RepID=UPI0035A2B270